MKEITHDLWQWFDTLQQPQPIVDASRSGQCLSTWDIQLCSSYAFRVKLQIIENCQTNAGDPQKLFWPIAENKAICYKKQEPIQDIVPFSRNKGRLKDLNDIKLIEKCE